MLLLILWSHPIFFPLGPRLIQWLGCCWTFLFFPLHSPCGPQAVFFKFHSNTTIINFLWAFLSCPLPNIHRFIFTPFSTPGEHQCVIPLILKQEKKRQNQNDHNYSQSCNSFPCLPSSVMSRQGKISCVAQTFPPLGKSIVSGNIPAALVLENSWKKRPQFPRNQGDSINFKWAQSLAEVEQHPDRASVLYACNHRQLDGPLLC